LISVTTVALLGCWVLIGPSELAAPASDATSRSIEWALSGFSNRTVWPSFAAFMFASIEAHVTAMLPIMLSIRVAIPEFPVAKLTLPLAFTPGFMGVLTPYASTSGPVYLGSGITALAVCHLVLAGATTSRLLLVGTILWGLQLGIIDGLIASNVADVAPDDLRGTAFGVYYFVVGVAALIASTLAGVLWGIGGAAMTFTVGALIASMALVALGCGRSILGARRPD